VAGAVPALPPQEAIVRPAAVTTVAMIPVRRLVLRRVGDVGDIVLFIVLFTVCSF
jgi:hypothetical protein